MQNQTNPPAARPSLKARIKGCKWLFEALQRLKHAPYPLLSGYMRLCHRLLGVGGNKVFFSSYDGGLYNDNPRAVAEALRPWTPRRMRLAFEIPSADRLNPA